MQKLGAKELYAAVHLEQGRGFNRSRPPLTPRCPELLPVPPHDRGCQLQPNADAATIIDIGTLGGNAPDNILGGQYRYHLPSP